MNNIEQYKILHSKDASYGITGGAYIDEVCLFIDFLKPETVLDYGCGKGALIKELSKRYKDIKFYGYDPAIQGRDKLPVDKVDFVINTDVLEHVPQEELSNVIKEISGISQNVFFVLHHYPAEQILPNGENAHCTIKPDSWYYQLFEKYFKDILVLKSRSLFNSAVVTFKLLPEWINKYNTLIGNETNNYLTLKNELDDLKAVFKFLHRKELKRLLFQYRLKRFFSFGKRRKHYAEKIIMIKNILNKF